MKEIPLTQGAIALVDDDDYLWLSQYKWCYNHSTGYAFRNKKISDCERKVVTMHREILGQPAAIVDHKDFNGINNQRSNLRLTDKAGNGHNRKPPRTNTSGYKGVHWLKRERLWEVQIRCHGKRKTIGAFASIHVAARAWNAAAKILHGEFAYENIVPEDAI